MDTQLEIVERLGYLIGPARQSIDDRMIEVRRMIHGLIKRLA